MGFGIRELRMMASYRFMYKEGILSREARYLLPYTHKQTNNIKNWFCLLFK